MDYFTEYGPFDKNEDIILIFAPEAMVTPHFAMQAVLARTLMDQGYRVLVTRCRGQLSRCPVLDSVNASYHLSCEEQRSQFCQQCVLQSEAVSQVYGLEALEFEEYAKSEHFKTVEDAVCSYQGHPTDFIFDGVKFGALGAGDYALCNKHSEFDNLTVDQRHGWATHTANCLLTYLIIKEACTELPIKRILAFNPYAIMIGAAVAAMKLNIPFINVSQSAHMDVDRQRLIMVPRLFTTNIWYDWITDWYRWRDLAISEASVKEISDDVLVRQFGKGAQHYSPSKSSSCEAVLQTLNLSTDKKLLVAYTSSLDEFRSGSLRIEGLGMKRHFQLEPFGSQVEWLESLVDYIEQSEDLQLVIRIHPREAPNKRDAQYSQHYKTLLEKFSGEYKNTRLVWPQDKVSSYDLAEAADVVLTSWSTIGLEMARLGVPVVTAYRHYNCIDDDFLAWGGSDKEEYFQTIRRALNKQTRIEDVIGSYRTYHYFIFAMALRIDDVIPSPDFVLIPQYSKSREAPVIEDVVINGTTIASINRKKMLAQQSTDYSAKERAAVVKSLQRIVHFYCTGERDESPEPLIVMSDTRLNEEDLMVLSNAQSPSQCILVIHNREIAYFNVGEWTIRYSPMLARLGTILGEDAGVTCQPKTNTRNQRTGAPKPLQTCIESSFVLRL